MTNDQYKQQVAFERCTDFMVRMIQKYGSEIKSESNKKSGCDKKTGVTRKYPADNGMTGAVEYDCPNKNQG